LAVVASAATLSTARANTILEFGYYASLPLTFTGVHLGAYGSSYQRHRSRYRLFENISLAPMQRTLDPTLPRGKTRSGDLWGVSLSGRF
jgi:hypothetical protein